VSAEARAWIKPQLERARDEMRRELTASMMRLKTDPLRVQAELRVSEATINRIWGYLNAGT
jgi:hypothetical protein